MHNNLFGSLTIPLIDKVFHAPLSRLLRAFAACSLFALATSASATHLQIEGGRSYMDRYGTQAAFVEAVFNPHRIGDSRFSWSPDVLAGWINDRDIAKYNRLSSRYHTSDRVFLAAVGARFQYGETQDWYHHLFFSVQPALHTGRTQALSTSYEFVSTFGWQARILSFQFRHISNGATGGPNRGDTMALIGVGFDF